MTDPREPMLRPGQTTNELMAWGFRAIIGIATVIGLPVAGAMLNRLMNSADEVSALVRSHDAKLQIIQNGIDEIRDVDKDFEQRLRTLERK